MLDEQQSQPLEDHQQPEEYDRDDPKDLVDQQLNDIGDRIDEPDPKLYVDVNVGKNKMERIVVYEGDTAESLANKASYAAEKPPSSFATPVSRA